MDGLLLDSWILWTCPNSRLLRFNGCSSNWTSEVLFVFTLQLTERSSLSTLMDPELSNVKNPTAINGSRSLIYINWTMVVSLLKHNIPFLSQFTRMSSSLQYYLIPLVLFFGVVYPEKVMALELVCFFYGVLPLLDGLFTLDTQNPTK